MKCNKSKSSSITCFEKAKIEQETALNLCEIDNTRPEAVPVAQKNQYIPKLPNITDHDCLCTSLSRFADSMQEARIPSEQWESCLRDLLAG